MAAAIGAVTAVFSVVNGVLLKPLPYPEPARLVAYWNGVSPARSDVLNPEALAALREESRGLEAVSMYVFGRQTLNAEGSAAVHELIRVSPGFFSDVLGVPPALGRDFTPEDERAGAPPTAIISDGLWRNHFGSDPEIIGRIIRPRPSPGLLSGEQYPPLEIIGVLPPRFRSPADLETPDIWTVSGPIASGNALFGAFGRLRPGVGFEEARAELAAVHERVLQAGGERMSDRQIQLTELTALHDARSQGQLILIFFAAVLAVLLVGVANLTGLEMARLPRLESDLSIHAAVGAARGRLVRITMARSVLLCLAGGLAGMLLAVAAHDFITASLPSGFPRQLDVGSDSNVLLFSIGISVVCSLVIASVPAIRASRPNLGALLASADRSTTQSRGRRRFLNLLTVVQCGVTLVLVFAAGLLIHTFWILTTIDTGFDPDDLMAFTVSFPDDYSTAARQNAYERAVEALSAAPGVEAAAVASSFPMHSVSTGSFRDPAGVSLPPNLPAGGGGNDESVEAGYQRYRFNAVSDAYFESMRIPVITGRAFTVDEARGAAPIAIVSESAARALWPERGAVGRRVEWASRGQGREFTVIGVAGDIRELYVWQASQPMIYVPMGEHFRTPAIADRPNYVIARTSLPPARRSGNPDAGRSERRAQRPRDERPIRLPSGPATAASGRPGGRRHRRINGGRAGRLHGRGVFGGSTDPGDRSADGPGRRSAVRLSRCTFARARAARARTRAGRGRFVRVASRAGRLHVRDRALRRRHLRGRGTSDVCRNSGRLRRTRVPRVASRPGHDVASRVT